MIGSGYCLLLTTLFNSRKSLTQWTLPSFLGVINVGEARGDKTPISTSEVALFLRLVDESQAQDMV